MNIIDYIIGYGHLTFKQAPVNELDSLIFSQIVYLNFSEFLGKHTKLKDACEQYLQKNYQFSSNIIESSNNNRRIILALMAGCRRYRNLIIRDFDYKVNEITEEQFGALTIDISRKEHFVVFKGTDEKMVGWKEDLNMGYMFPIPAQLSALDYLNEQLQRRGKFYVCGHSKGGNLTVYSTINANSDKIVKAFSIDGPGFPKEFVESDIYQMQKNKIVSIVPNFSSVGMVLYNDLPQIVCKSISKNFLEHHDLFNWQIDKNHLITVSRLSKISQFINKTLNNWYDEVSYEDRVILINTSYDILQNMGIKTVGDLYDKDQNFLKQFIKNFMKEEKNAKSHIISSLFLFLKNAGFNLAAFISEAVLPESILKKFKSTSNNNKNSSKEDDQ